MASAQSAAALLGRILLGLIYVMGGLNTIMNFQSTAEQVAREGVVLASLMLVIATILEGAGAIGLIAGFRTRFSALLLILFLVPVTLIMHDFWQYEGDAAQQEMFSFIRNLAFLGGLFMVLAFGGGGWSVDARRAPHPGRG